MLRESYQAMVAWVESELKTSGLGLSDWLALKSICDGRIASVGDVANILGIADGASTRLVDRLEKKELVRRNRSRADRRVVTLVAESDGLRLTSDMRARLQEQWHDRLGSDGNAQSICMFYALKLLRDTLANRGDTESTAMPTAPRL